MKILDYVCLIITYLRKSRVEVIDRDYTGILI